jgi:hypothetical protein|tara:strand:+ start:2514 stop:4199 length:1686 start_codon:yes stop_codon:yes gene_type:complete
MTKNKQNYMNNPNLPTVGAEFEYTPKMVKEIQKSTKNILHFAENYFHIVSLDEGKQKIKLHYCQKRVLRKMRDHRFFVLLASRQIGKTTMMTIYALWNACFNNDQRILIVANKEGTAIEIMNRVRLAYEELPNWLKPGVKEYGKTSVTFANGTKIGISTTTGTAARGQSVNILILDELAFIEPHLVEDFWKSVYPIISSSKKSKIFIASTANGTDNLFHKLYTGAEAGESNWACDKILWNEIPGRNEKWKYDTIKSIGSRDAFEQEFNCVFLTSGESTIDDDLFDRLKMQVSEPKFIFDEGKYLLWDEPTHDRIYIASVDTAEGLGKDASVIQIFDYTDMTNINQVACYHNNEISPYNFTEKVFEILQHWGNPLVCIERNNSGAQVVDGLKNNHQYENIVSWGASTASRKNQQLGIVSHTNTKYKGITNMRYWINDINAVQINDIHLVKELKNFIKYPNGTWGAKRGFHDDRVAAMMWNFIILIDELVSQYFEVTRYDTNNRPLELAQFDYGIKYFMNPTSMYSNEKENFGNVLPSIIGNANKVESEMDDLIQQGYKPWQP